MRNYFKTIENLPQSKLNIRNPNHLFSYFIDKCTGKISCGNANGFQMQSNIFIWSISKHGTRSLALEAYMNG